MLAWVALPVLLLPVEGPPSAPPQTENNMSKEEDMIAGPAWLTDALNDPLQTSMFSSAEDLRDQAIEKLESAYDNWINSVLKIISSIPNQQTFTTDYLW